MTETDRKTVNRRAFLRVDSSLSCKLVCLMPDGSLPVEGWADAEVIQIGGGGARVMTDLPVEDGCVVSLRLSIPEDGTIMRLSARIVSIIGDGPIKEICVKFVGISEQDRAVLVRHVFSEQIRQAKGKPSDQAGREDGQTDEDQGGN
jgi:c-di-GMP-binding flagellar brake protein YcgR